MFYIDKKYRKQSIKQKFYIESTDNIHHMLCSALNIYIDGRATIVIRFDNYKLSECNEYKKKKKQQRSSLKLKWASKIIPEWIGK